MERMKKGNPTEINSSMETPRMGLLSMDWVQPSGIAMGRVIRVNHSMLRWTTTCCRIPNLLVIKWA